jgi:Sulfatase-modifying factor enzyme 1
MGPSRGDTICGDVVIDALGPMQFGALALGPIHIAHNAAEPRLWLSTVERTLLPRSADVSRFMAGVGELARVALPGAVPLVLVDREADFCVVGYRAIDGAQTLAQLIEGGEDEAAARSLAAALARTLAEFHRRGFVHGLVTASTVLRAAGTWWTWQYGIAGMCAPDRLAPRLRPPGGDPVAPELRAGAGVSPAADVFGWAAAVACLLTGAIGSEAISLLLEDERDDPLRTLVRRCLEHAPELRPRDGAALLARLQVVLSASAPLASESTEISFEELNDGVEERVEDSRFGLPGDPPSLAASKPASTTKGGAREPAGAARGPRDTSVVELLVLGPDDGLEDEVAEPPRSTAAPSAPAAGRGGAGARSAARPESDELARLRAVHGDAAWRELAEQYLSEHPPTHEEVDALPVAELVVPGPTSTERRGGALGRVALIRTRVRTGPQKPVRPEVDGCTGSFDMSDEPAPEPFAPPHSADDARELPLGSDEEDEEPWDDPEAAVFDLDAAGGPDRVDVLDEEVDMEWPAGEPALVDPRGATWPVDAQAQTPHARFGKLGADDDTPAHPAPLAWLESNAEAVATVPLRGATPHPGGRIAIAIEDEEIVARAPPKTAQPLTVTPRPAAKPSSEASPKPARASKESVGAAPSTAPRAVDGGPVVVGAVAPSSSSGARPVLASVSSSQLARPMRPRSGGALAVAFAMLAGTIALATTLGLARHRGGISQLLGVSISGPAPVEPAAVPPTVLEPSDAATVPVPPAPATCPEQMRPIDARTCIDRGEFPGLSEIPRTQVDHAEARDACAARGARLCSTPEWRRACKGPDNWRHPYGPRGELDRCNGASASGAVQDLSRSGARDSCVTASGVFDLEGNVAEWVSEAVALGGDSSTRSPSCDTRSKPAAQTRAAALGFRCCLSLGEAPPAGI